MIEIYENYNNYKNYEIKQAKTAQTAVFWQNNLLITNEVFKILSP